MKYEIYYDRGSRSWWAYWVDLEGNQIGDGVFAHDRDECLIELGSIHSDRLNHMRSKRNEA